jgi:hypothetical protein
MKRLALTAGETNVEGNPKGKTSRKKPKRSYAQTGLNRLKARLSRRKGARKVQLSIEKRLDLRIPAARALIAERDGWISDRGGREYFSAKELSVLDNAARTSLYISHLDDWLLRQKSLVNARKKSVFAVLKERQALVDSLVRMLSTLGLERKEKPVLTLEEYLQQMPDEEPEAAGNGKPQAEEAPE